VTRHFGGALLSKLAPPAVQMLLLLAVARLGSFEDIGRLALASATSFTCGSLGEFGFGTSLSLPATYFGTPLPPVRGTRGPRLSAALAGSALYLLLWAGGLGGHETPFLIVAPLPALLALSYGYAGVMNAESGLQREGRITVLEAAGTLVVAGALVLAVDPLVAALVALTVVRGVGTLLRARIVHSLPQHDGASPRRVVRTQLWFVAAGTVLIVNGQIDVLMAGFVTAFATLSVFGPLMRTAYGLTLVAEALSWGLYGRPGSAQRPEHSRAVRFVQDWSRSAPWLGLASAAVFGAVAPWLIPVIVARHLSGLAVPILLFAAVVAVRFVGFSYGLRIARAGLQRQRLPGLLVAMVVLVASGLIGASMASLVVLAAGRLVAEVTVVAAYALVVHRRRVGEPAPAAGPHPEAL
jgi:O-antigen/teichoic acid export membrane protein